MTRASITTFTLRGLSVLVIVLTGYLAVDRIGRDAPWVRETHLTLTEEEEMDQLIDSWKYQPAGGGKPVSTSVISTFQSRGHEEETREEFVERHNAAVAVRLETHPSV